MGGKSIGWKVPSVVDCAMARTESFSPLEANECEVEIRMWVRRVSALGLSWIGSVIFDTFKC